MEMNKYQWRRTGKRERRTEMRRLIKVYDRLTTNYNCRKRKKGSENRK